LPAPCAGWGELSASFGGVGSVDCRSAWTTDFAEAFALLAGFCSDILPGGFFFESIFGVDGRADSFGRDAIGVAFGFGVSTGGGAESVEAGVGGAVAIGAPSGLIICGAADGPAGFGVSAGGGAESVEAGVDGAVAIGAPSGPILCVGTSAAGWFSGAGMNAGVADSRLKEARCGASTSAFPAAGTEPLFAGAVLASGRVSKLPACEGAACWLSSISERESFEGSRVCSFCGLTGLSVAATEGSRSAGSGALFMRAKLTPIVAAPASATPPPISFQLRELGLVDF
jgi:hypothetical protein